MYRRPKFLEVLLEIRQEMARQADYDVDLFVELARSGQRPAAGWEFSLIDLEPDDNTSRSRISTGKQGRKKVHNS